MRGGVGSIDAGHVYSHMILGGQTTYPFNNNTGAGPFVLGTGGNAWWGKTNVTNGGRVDIPISVAAGKTMFEGSLWWPEGTGRPQRRRPRADRAGRQGARHERVGRRACSSARACAAASTRGRGSCG